ncbi:hypothetical protein SAMN05216525_13387 [Bradyrhizobium sp. Gha]|nr:hypothetical protein SAMN05216525_13387 [Bradyrhizobium sp. Gha]
MSPLNFFAGFNEKPHPRGLGRRGGTTSSASTSVAGATGLSCCYLSSTKIFGSGLTGTTVCHDVIRQRLTFAQSPHTGAFDSADVNEDVVAAVRWLDKAKALLGIKPLHCTRVHTVCFRVRAGPGARSCGQCPISRCWRMSETCAPQDLRRKRNSCSASIDDDTIHQQLRKSRIPRTGPSPTRIRRLAVPRG